MLTPRLLEMKERTRSGFYRQYRTAPLPNDEIKAFCAQKEPFEAADESFRLFLEAEKPQIFPKERFFFTRTREGRAVQVQPGLVVENLTPDWETLILCGLSGRMEAARKKLAEPNLPDESKIFLKTAISMMQRVLDFSERYACAAEKAGDAAGAELLRKVPRFPAKNLHEALQSIFFLFSMLHFTALTLQGFGRMDQYLLPLYEKEMAAGTLTREEAKELFAEFFIMLNRENDIYGLAQRGDDGESMMLGGCRRDGSDGNNDLTLLLLEVSRDVSMINPKINLRINSHTPQHLLEAGVHLTRQGLGFPQYSNDEIVIPALIRFGYSPDDARDYTVAACWEFVVKDGRDVPNFTFINLPKAADQAIRKALKEHLPFETLLSFLEPAISEQFPPMRHDRLLCPNPLASALLGKCIERGRDIHRGGGTHYHYGCLGSGSSSAADALAAVRQFVYEEKRIAPEELLAALENDFEGYEELRALLKSGPKVGNNDDVSNHFLSLIFDKLASACEKIKDNGLGGRVRPGTGSAQGYAFLTRTNHPLRCGATADGRKNGDFFSSSLSPAPGVRAKGILSILQTYGNLDYNRLCNGGPITMEFSPAYFRDDDSIGKTAEFLRAFVRSGCQQLQMNLLDKAELADAQLHPENHRDLIVRVWGWSGYFVELDRMYQDQIIARQAHGEVLPLPHRVSPDSPSKKAE